MNVRGKMPGISEQIALQQPRPARDERETVRDEQFAALVRRQTQFVFRVAYSILRNVPDADDVVQETFLKVYRSPARESIMDERAFLARTAWRIAVDRARRKPKTAPCCETEWPGPNPEQAAILADWNSVVFRLIDALPEHLRQPLALSSVEELSSREIARVMGIREGTVRTRLMRARQILKQKLNALGAGRHEE